MLNFAEEILLLTLDDKTGTFYNLPKDVIRTALAGALLMDLALANRIDTDLESLTVVSTEPTGDPLIDQVLQRLQGSDSRHTTSHWVNEIAWHSGKLREQVLQSLIDKGVLKIQDRKILWVFAKRKYPLMNDREVKEVRARLRELVFNQDIPDPREAVLIGLLYACNMVDTLFTEQELPEVMPRLTELAKLDLIGREVAQSIRDIYSAMNAYSRNRIID
ncbi:MAG: GOLPH3/VPS74 family protein [Desulfonatronovibrio sp.]